MTTYEDDEEVENEVENENYDTDFGYASETFLKMITKV
jgi:hypothetical protein